MNFSDVLQTAQALGLELPTPAWIAGCILFSLIGMWAWYYGKVRQAPPIRWIGLALMLYGYVVSPTWLLYAVGVALCVAIWWHWPGRSS